MAIRRNSRRHPENRAGYETGSLSPLENRACITTRGQNFDVLSDAGATKKQAVSNCVPSPHDQDQVQVACNLNLILIVKRGWRRE